MRKLLFKSFNFSLILAFIACNVQLRPVFAQETIEIEEEGQVERKEEIVKSETFNMLTGEVKAIETKNLVRVAVANPEIVDISDAKADKVFIAGKKSGQTEVFIWDDDGKRDITVRIASENLDVLISRIEEILNKSGIKGVMLQKNDLEGKIVLYGSIPKVDKDILDKILDPYIEKIINLVKVEVIEDMIQIDVQVTELSTTFTKQIGIDWSTGDQAQSTSTTSTSSGSSTTGQGTTASGGFEPSFGELLPQSNGTVSDMFKIGKFLRTSNSALVAKIDALVSEGKGRVLSKPRLLVMSGKEASFLVGGEVPIRTTTTSASGGGTSQENVSFKQYGVNMTITPTIREGKIDILLNVQISDIDKSTTNEKGDVGYITRQAQTHLFLDNKQNVVMAGIIKHSEGETVKGIPYLSKIPIVGAMFRTRSSANPNSDTEMVISLTPTILRSKTLENEQVKMPSKRVESFTKEIEGSFEKEVMKDAPIKSTIMQEPIKNFNKIQSEKAPVTLATSNVPNMILLSYIRSIQYKISENINYPIEALSRGWEGTVKLRLRVLRNGSLVDCDVLQGTGHDLFDIDAVNAAKRSAPFLAFPNEMKQEDLVITIPIVYNPKATSDMQSQTVVASY